MFDKVWVAVNENDRVMYKSFDLQKVRDYVRELPHLKICLLCKTAQREFLWKNVNV